MNDIIDLIEEKPLFIQSEFLNEKDFENLTNDLDPELKESAKTLLEYLNSKFYTVDVSSPKLYTFTLPDNYIEKFQDLDCSLNFRLPQRKNQLYKKLSSQQLKTIWQKGKFHVKTEDPEFDDIWQVAYWLSMGYENIILKFKKNYAKIWRLLIYAVDLYRFSRVTLTFKYKLRPNIWSGLLQLPMIFLNLLELFIGLPCYYLSRDVHAAAKEEINRNRNIYLMSCDFNQIKALSRALRKVNEKTVIIPKSYLSENIMMDIENHNNIADKNKNLLLDIDKKFEEAHRIVKEKTLADLGDVFPEEYEQAIEKLEREKYINLFNYIADPEFQIEGLNKAIVLEILQGLTIIEEMTNEYVNDLELKQENLKNEIINEYPWKSKVEYWFKREIKKRFKVYKMQRKDELHESIIEEMKSKNLIECGKLYSTSIDYVKNQKHDIKRIEKDLKKDLFYPAYTKTISRRIWAPYRVEETKTKRSTTYALKKYSYIEIGSTFIGWRVYLFIVHLAIKTCNLVYRSLRHALSGQFGLRALYRCSVYYMRYTIDNKTGEIKNNRDRVVPFIRRFRKILNGIGKSRKAFEADADTGLLGKNLARVFNLFECYIIRFLLVGCIIVLILHPIFNILVIIGSFLLALTSVLWIFIYRILKILFKLLVYDYMALKYYKRNENELGSFLDRILSPSRAFPLIQAFIKLIWGGIFQICYCIIVPPVNLVLSLLLLILSSFLFSLRIIYYFIIHNFVIRCGARIPLKDTNMAWRVAGPGISTNIYYSISIDGASTLCLIQIEIDKLTILQKQMKNYLRKPLKEFKNQLLKFVSVLSVERCNFIKLEAEKDRIDILIKKLDKQIKDKIFNLRKNFDNLPLSLVRFTTTEISQLKIITENILRKMLAKDNLDQYIWNQYSLAPGQYKKLVHDIIIKAFKNCIDVLEPLNDIEKRIVMVKSENSKNKNGALEKILEGEVELEQLTPVLNQPKQKSLQIIRVNCNDIVNIYSSNICRIKDFKHLELNNYDVLKRGAN